ncbi:2-amino-4-hydroxy-6-hydroxymethyldihydropteridine diphosphokinase [Cellulomonas fimi]|uniref:Bifunctional folate synthesis protein n=1 Tax=Cellulomonas fimi TaxID=1708 RepID=A0A7Y0LZM4_CELFI|nr:2-amino-4-hydroxy-6-hydroxymethyldihydropteridine diphosphokinase [Cellulomonas fimi]NMR20353.1 2-amino-4-hydroxy-6-hydroxymethyldihydropteridine diphosphokinase [Cellulomonas fimi]
MQPSGVGPASDESGRPYDQIRVTGITATGFHGVFEHERREGQLFRADVVVHVDTRRAAATDDLARTVNYGVLAEQVAAVLAGEPADLVETVAERIAATALAHPLVAAVDVVVHKPQAPITVPFEDVVVAIRRDHQRLPAAEPWSAERAAQRLRTEPGVSSLRHPPAPASSEPVTPPRAETATRPSGADATAVLALAPEPDVDAFGVEAVRAAVASASGPAAAGTPEPDRLDQEPDEAVEVVLALGSNLGAPQDILRNAVSALAAVPGLEILAVSPLARTAPVGGPAQPDFLNAVVVGRTTLSPRRLLRATQAVESAHGRERHEHWGPRTLDIDVIVYGSVLAVTEDLELPHPRAHQRAFVLQPWVQIAPDAVLPGLGGGPVAALAATAPDRDGIRWLALDWLSARPGAAAPAATAHAAPAPAAPAAPGRQDPS